MQHEMLNIIPLTIRSNQLMLATEHSPATIANRSIHHSLDELCKYDQEHQ